MNEIKVLLKLAFCAALFTAAGATQADGAKGDGKTYSGLGCTEIPNGKIFIDNTAPYGDNDVRYNAAGWAFNSSVSESIWVACPIVRDHTASPMKRAWVTVLNQTSEKVLCEIESFDSFGLFLEESSTMVFSPNPDFVTGFLSNDKDDDDNTFDNNLSFVPKLANVHGYYALFCSLPAAEPVVDSDGPGSGASFKMAYVVKYIIEEGSN